MSTPSPPVVAPQPRAALHRVLILAAALWVAVPGVDLRSIENREHPRFARIAQTMLEDGDWVLQRYAGEPYTNKPPLLVWLIALGSIPFGHVNPWTARLPSVLASLAAGLATYGIGRRLADRTVGLCAALILVSTWKWTWYAHSITTDMLLSGCIAVSMYCIVRATGRRFNQAAWWFGAGVAAGLGALAKGPMGPLVPVAAGVAAWMLLGRERAPVRRSVVFSVVGFALVCVPWVVLVAGRIGWHEVWVTIDREIIHRATSGEVQAEPFWYYAENLPVDLLPWTLLWPAAALTLRPARLPERWRHAVWVGVAWAVVPVVLLSVPYGKASRFIVPTYPGWALLGGLVVADTLRRAPDLGRLQARLVHRLLIAVAVLFLLSPLIVLLAPSLPLAEPIPERYYTVLRVGGGTGVLLGIMGAYLLLVHRGANRLRAAFGIIVVGTLLYHGLQLRLLFVDNAERSPYRTAAMAVERAAGGRPLISYRYRDHRLLYHLPARVYMSDEMIQRRFAEATPYACLLVPGDWLALQELLAPHTADVVTVDVAGTPVLVVVSRAGATPAPAILPRNSAPAAAPTPGASAHAPPS